MREVIDLRRLQAMPAEHAAALLVAHLSDPTGDQDGEILDRWLADDETNPIAWARMTNILSAFDAPDEDDLFGDLRANARAAGPSPAIPSRLWLAVAAAIALIFVGVAAWTSGNIFPHGGSPQIAGAPAPDVRRDGPVQVARAGKGEIRAVPLPDGSVVTLDTQSAVEIAYSRTGRNLKLIAGRAQFEVRHSKEKPFIVHASGYEVVAVGTRFDVRLTTNGTTVLLFEGRLRIADLTGANAFTLESGHKAVLEKGAPPQLGLIDQDKIDKWQEGILTFRNQQLSEVAAQLNRYSTDRLTINDTRVATLRVTGTFRPGDLGRFARTITALYPVKVVQVNPREREIQWAGTR